MSHCRLIQWFQSFQGIPSIHWPVLKWFVWATAVCQWTSTLASCSLRPSSHRTRNTSQRIHANYGTHCGQWECSHSLMQICIKCAFASCVNGPYMWILVQIGKGITPMKEWIEHTRFVSCFTLASQEYDLQLCMYLSRIVKHRAVVVRYAVGVGWELDKLSRVES